MKKFWLILFLIHIQTYALSQNDFEWQLSEEKGTIKVYNSDVHKSTGIVPIKATNILNHSMPKILSVIADVTRKKEWVPNLLKANIVEQKNKYERIEYALYDSPWPFHDREFIIQTKGSYNPKDKSIYIEIKSTKDSNVPLNTDYVRGFTHIGNVYMRYIDKEKTFFEIILLTDFKGNIPTWIINLVQRKWPYKLFRNLESQLIKNDIVLDKTYLTP